MTQGHSETAKVLRDNGGKAEASKQIGGTALTHARLFTDIPKSPKFCSITAQISNQAAIGGWTALMIAESIRFPDTGKVLLDGGANPRQENSDDKNIRDYAG